MQTFRCLACGQSVYFDDSACPRCGAAIGFIPDQMRVVSIEHCEDDTWRATPARPWSYQPGLLERLFGAKPKIVEAEDTGERYRKCANGPQYHVCNWLVGASSDELWCPACRTNRTIPNLARPGNLELWFRLERAKRRALFGLMRLGLSVQDRCADPDQGLAFDFLSAQDADPSQPILTGHCNGLITIAIDELEKGALGAYDASGRNLVGLFQRLLGYYCWDRLIRDGDRLDEFRTLFGDERQHYSGAQEAHRHDGDLADWPDRNVGPSASNQPWEDWAETWELYLRIVDILETAGQFGALGELRATDEIRSGAESKLFDFPAGFQQLPDRWQLTAVALNNLNRNLGQPDIHPDRLSSAVIEKLSFVHRTIGTASMS